MDDIYRVVYALEVETEHHCAGISSSFFRRSDVLLLDLLLLALSGVYTKIWETNAGTHRLPMLCIRVNISRFGHATGISSL